MRSRVFAVVFAAAAAVLAGACHRTPPELVSLDAGAPAPPASSSPATAASSSDETADAGDADSGVKAALAAFCTAAFSADDDRMRDKCAAEDFKLTQSMARAAAKVCANDLAIALGRSRAEFDADAGAKCAEMLHQKPLAQTSETDSLYAHPPCDRILHGLQAAGQPCRFSVECGEGLACVGYKIGVDGTCKKPPAAKEACTPQPYGSIVNVAASGLHHPACAAGAFCDGTTCQPRIPAGKACSKSEACTAGLSCVMGKCGARPAAGAPCNAATDCTYGLWCDHAGDAGGAGKCAVRRDAGQDCTAREACKGRCDLPKKPKNDEPGKCAAVCGSG
ncbi:MAG: Dickkopf N-terminal cysteine-rich domain-containing protein [Polyangiaceae bacterium]|jgi:hypothetical protein